MKVEKQEVERLLADCETPFTDFRVEEFDGMPKAVFDALSPEQSSVLSHFLYPDKNYIGALYIDTLHVASKEVLSMSYEDDLCIATFTFWNLIIETKESVGTERESLRIKIPLGDVKLLLLKWKFQLMRWEAAKRRILTPRGPLPKCSLLDIETSMTPASDDT